MEMLIHAPEFSDRGSPHQVVVDLVFHTSTGIKCCLFVLTETIVTDAANDEWGQRANLLVQRVQKIEARMKHVFIWTRTIQIHIKNIDLATQFVGEIVTETQSEPDFIVQQSTLVIVNPLQTRGDIELSCVRDGCVRSCNDRACGAHQTQCCQVSFFHGLSCGVFKCKKRSNCSPHDNKKRSKFPDIAADQQICDGVGELQQEGAMTRTTRTATKVSCTCRTTATSSP